MGLRRAVRSARQQSRSLRRTPLSEHSLTDERFRLIEVALFKMAGILLWHGRASRRDNATVSDLLTRWRKRGVGRDRFEKDALASQLTKERA